MGPRYGIAGLFICCNVVLMPSSLRAPGQVFLIAVWFLFFVHGAQSQQHNAMAGSVEETSQESLGGTALGPTPPKKTGFVDAGKLIFVIVCVVITT